MRVVALTVDYPPNRFIGSELATHQMLAAVARRGHQVDVYTQNGVDDYRLDGVNVWAGYGGAAREAARANVVVAHIELGKRIAGVQRPLVGICHNSRTAAEATGRAPWSLLVHNSQTMVDEFAPYRTCPYIVVRPPVDWRDYIVDRSDADAITLVNVTGEKGSDTFYEMARRFPDRRFLGVMGGWGDPEIKSLPNVELVGQTGDMRAIYAQTRILLMPSEHESWGRVAVEAMSSGIPVLATDLPGPREAIGAGGFLVDLDWWDRYEELIRLLDDPAVYAEVSAAASARAKELDPTVDLNLFADTIEALEAA